MGNFKKKNMNTNYQNFLFFLILVVLSFNINLTNTIKLSKNKISNSTKNSNIKKIEEELHEKIVSKVRKNAEEIIESQRNSTGKVQNFFRNKVQKKFQNFNFGKMLPMLNNTYEHLLEVEEQDFQ